MQLETWEETSLAMAQENDILKLRIFEILNKMSLTQRSIQSNTIHETLSDCGYTLHEIELFINGTLRLGD